MKIIKEKKALFDIQLNSLSETDSPTKKECEFILHNFDINSNNSFISKETAMKAFASLESTPIVAKYFENTGDGSNDDALGSHEAVLGKDRSGEDYIVKLKTTPIGVFTEPAYITTVKNDQNEDVEVVAGKGYLWASRFPDVVGLLQQWINEGVNVSSSMEILYDEYLFKDGVEEILNFVYEGNCILNSEDRGDHAKVHPAYDTSKLTRLVAQAIDQGSNEEEEGMAKMFEKVFALSHSDIRTHLYKVLDVTLGDNQYSYIRDSYDDHFVVEIDTATEDSYESNTYKFNYTKSADDVITIDFESKKEVVKKTEWVELESTKLFEADIKEKDEAIASLNAAKEALEVKFNSTSEELVSLNSEVSELKEYKEKFDQAQFEKEFDEKQEYYSSKFASLGADEQYNTDEVQELVKQAVTSQEAIVSLNSMLVNLVVETKTVAKTDEQILQLNQKRENLIELRTDFDSRYK